MIYDGQRIKGLLIGFISSLSMIYVGQRIKGLLIGFIST